MVLQPDGKVVVAGANSQPGTSVIARYMPSGSLDTGFAGDGVANGVSAAEDIATWPG